MADVNGRYIGLGLMALFGCQQLPSDAAVRVRIPKLIAKSWTRFGDWANKTTFGILRVDYLLGLGFVLGVGWTFYSTGWFAALEVATLFVFILICCLWIF